MSKQNSTRPIRVRFAPSPTGIMHLGNVRAALMNYLFAARYNGTFVLRIEDTDQERNAESYTQQILDDMAWLGLTYAEGPGISGPYAPYFQSQRTDLYTQYLARLEEKKAVYRCFCTKEELEKKKQRQIALKQPPRYDRTCAKLSEELIAQKLEQNISYLWRFKLPDSRLTITDSARGAIEFDLSKISDFALTRANGTFTFMFANFVDDVTMCISHVIRGEDHLTNTAGQAALYQALGCELPLFWHLPIMVNTEGKKLSKRDFGFSLEDLKKDGFLPEAICNYLTIIGGSFETELGTKEQLASSFPFNTLHASGQITYDLEKLRWINHHWIMKLSTESLAVLARPFLIARYPAAAMLANEKYIQLIGLIKLEVKTLNEVADKLAFFFERPALSQELFAYYGLIQVYTVMSTWIAQNQSCCSTDDIADYTKKMQDYAKEQGIGTKSFFTFIRVVLTGKAEGLGVKDLAIALGVAEYKNRLHGI